jgi:hypothetical protein
VFRDVRFTTDQLLLEASRVPVQLRHVGSKNQSTAMRLFRHLAHTSEIPSGVYADFFQVLSFLFVWIIYWATCQNLRLFKSST